MLFYEQNQRFFSPTVELGLGLNPASKQSEELVQFIKREAVRNSPYRNQMLQVLVDKSAYADSVGDIYVEAANITEDSLGDIYLPAQINDHVQLFDSLNTF
ncbi:MAG: hypothetical protein WAV76_16415 [Bacteroidota bacterium]